MLKTRLALAASARRRGGARRAARRQPAAPAEDLQSKLEAKEAKLSKVRERKGVLTTTISHYGDRIDTADRRGRGAAQPRRPRSSARLDAKQAELDQAVAELDVAKKHLAAIRARLKRALVALRERLVAMYETGTPGRAQRHRRLRRRTTTSSTGPNTSNRIHGMDEAVVGRVRELRDQVRRTVAAAARAPRTGSKRRATRSPPKSRRWPTPARAVQSRQAALVAARADRVAALAQDRRTHEEELDGTSPRSRARSPRSSPATGSAPLPAGPIQAGSGSGLIWPVRRPGRLAASGRARSTAATSTTRGSTSPCREARRSAPPPPAPSIFTEPEASSGGYGNYTCIDHGGGLSTCYAHQESLRGQRRPARLPGPDDRLQRLHRLLLRPPPPFRGADKRRSHRPDGLPLAAGQLDSDLGNPILVWRDGIRLPLWV